MSETDKLQEKQKLPIGFMDSGLGGLSVLREAIKLMPKEDFIYYGDSLHAPYGVKPQAEIRDLTFAVVEKLLDMGIKGLAVACNTATSAAVRLLRNTYPELPIVGIEPAVKPAVTESHGGRILVMATPMTLKQEKFQNLLAKYREQADIVPVQCDGLMETGIGRLFRRKAITSPDRRHRIHRSWLYALSVPEKRTPPFPWGP